MEGIVATMIVQSVCEFQNLLYCRSGCVAACSYISCSVGRAQNQWWMGKGDILSAAASLE